MKRSLLLALAFLALPTTAEAGNYTVYSCNAANRSWPNNGWRAETNVATVTEDVGCPGGLGLRVAAGAQTPDNTVAVVSFTSPAGTSIVDFTLTRQITYRNPVAEGTHRYYALYTIRNAETARNFAGAGNFHDPTRNALNAQRSWYGYPENDVVVGPNTVSRASFPALNTYPGDGNKIELRLGCYLRGTPCSVVAPGAIENLVLGSAITINDPRPPAVTVEASGLLGGGVRSGSDPVTITASDATGIRRIELFDVTNPAAPVIVGYEDYAENRTDTNRLCDYSRPAPCPGLSRETVRPASLQAGQRLLLVRVTDTGGNVVDQGPYPVTALTPSDRGALNGTGATDTGTLGVTWTTGGRDPRTLGFGRRAGISGRLLNSAGAPVAGAKVSLHTRDLRADAPFVSRTTVVTGADGTFRTTVSSTASRLLQFSWMSHANDVHPAAEGSLTLHARAAAKLSVSTRRPRVGRRFTLRGRLRGVSRGGVTVILQGRRSGSRRWSTFADTTSTSSGRFRARYRFRASGSRGRRFVFRARIRPTASFPYRTGHSRTVTVRVR